MTITPDYIRRTWVYKIDPPVFEPNSFGQALLLSEGIVTVFDDGDPDVSIMGRVATKAGKLHARASGMYNGYGQVCHDLEAQVLAYWQKHDSPWAWENRPNDPAADDTTDDRLGS